MILGGISGIGVIKRRPKAYRSDGMTVGGNRGFYLASLPRAYPMNAPQRRVRDAAKACGIRKGMSRPDLRRAMIDCIPGKF